MQIIFNGKTYNSLEEMPANERQAYEQMFQIFSDANGNGIPDFLEGDIARNVMSAFTSTVHYDGKVYSNMEELPTEARRKVQEAFTKLNQLGVVTAGPSMRGADKAFEPAFRASRPLLQQEPAIQESGGRNWLIILGFLGALLFCSVAVAIAIFFLR